MAQDNLIAQFRRQRAPATPAPAGAGPADNLITRFRRLAPAPDQIAPYAEPSQSEGILDFFSKMRGRDWGALGSRIGGPLAGAGTGAAIGAAFGGVGAIPGALIGLVLGGGAGGAAGELGAQALEGRESFNWPQVATQGAIGAIPESAIFRGASLLGKVAKGAGINAGATVGTSLAETGELPTRAGLMLGTAAGGGAGALLHGVGRFGRGGRGTPPPAARPGWDPPEVDPFLGPRRSIADVSSDLRRAPVGGSMLDPEPGTARTFDFTPASTAPAAAGPDVDPFFRPRRSIADVSGDVRQSPSARVLDRPAGSANTLEMGAVASPEELSKARAMLRDPDVISSFDYLHGPLAPPPRRPPTPPSSGLDVTGGRFADETDRMGRGLPPEFPRSRLVEPPPGATGGLGVEQPRDAAAVLSEFFGGSPEPAMAARPRSHNWASPRLDAEAAASTAEGPFVMPGRAEDVPRAMVDRLRMVLGDETADEILDSPVWRARNRGVGFASAEDVGRKKLTYSASDLRGNRFLWNRERKALKALEDLGGPAEGFMGTELLAPLGGALGGAAAAPLINPENPYAGAAAGAGAGLAAGMGALRFLGRRAAPAAARRLDDAAFEVMDPSAARLGVNASGESAASLEAMNRLSGMQNRGEAFVVYDRMGNRRAIPGADAVDYVARQGETFGVEGPNGFMKLDDRGGRAPSAAAPSRTQEPGPSGRPAGRATLDAGGGATGDPEIDAMLAGLGGETAPAARSARFGGDDAGFASTEALHQVGIPAAGAVAGSVAGPMAFQDEDPRVAGVGGAGLGALAGLAWTNPQLLERMRYSSLLSGAAIPKSLLGNVGALGARALEMPGGVRRVASEFFTPQTLDAAKSGWQQNALREVVSGPQGGPLTLPGRVMGTFDRASRDVLERTGLSPSEAERLVLMGMPSTETSKDIVNLVRNRPAVRVAVPFARTALNLVERGIERTPGLGALENVRAWSGATPREAARKQLLGAGAIGLGAAVGSEASPGGSLEDYQGWAPFAHAALGPYALPGALAALAAQSVASRDPLQKTVDRVGNEFQENLPLPKSWSLKVSNLLRQMVPFGGAMRYLSPADPSSFDTSDSLFAPTIAQIPLLNEWLLQRKRRGGSR